MFQKKLSLQSQIWGEFDSTMKSFSILCIAFSFANIVLYFLISGPPHIITCECILEIIVVNPYNQVSTLLLLSTSLVACFR